MKNTVGKRAFYLLAAMLFSLSIFAACSQQETTPADTDATVNENKPADAGKTGDVGSAGTAVIEPANGSTTMEAAENVSAESEDVKNLLANQDKLNALVLKGDVAGCKDLDMPQFQISCETNILVNKAKSNTDLAVCDASSTPDIKIQCLDLVAKKQF